MQTRGRNPLRQGQAMSDRLTAVFANILKVPADRLSDKTSPSNTPEWDSLAVINLTLALEFEFGVKLTMQEIMSMTSIGIARSVLTRKGIAEL